MCALIRIHKTSFFNLYLRIHHAYSVFQWCYCRNWKPRWNMFSYFRCRQLFADYFYFHLFFKQRSTILIYKNNSCFLPTFMVLNNFIILVSLESITCLQNFSSSYTFLWDSSLLFDLNEWKTFKQKIIIELILIMLTILLLKNNAIILYLKSLI